MITDSDMFGTWNGHGSVAYIVSTCSQDILTAIEVKASRSGSIRINPLQ